ncbi:cyclopropane-fatty-acyl-phospholipid synthase family protein [Planomicrobium sp. CPCC 101079]|uniref:SAM-dependent methyltransferase n=1 Tax=Planomicrobium sp. CPCC 101079 TaxID=2599618 RepID=UPI0011B7FC21|nr:class I SAM-dependent methyltransferase [Planomicrobium sp. CPCC 101079]TWT01956.1 class I SAM-dependent methyltransferase [Planomicrobium sp. CPCC 101079]
MKEKDCDKRLNVKTEGNQSGFNDSPHFHRYEPTPYALLDQLFSQYKLHPGDRLVDFGCGKGRLNFYVHHVFGCETTGVELNPVFYSEALENQARYVSKRKNASGKIRFYCCPAQEYEIDPRDNRFYFFNPFSVQIFMSVIANILRSVEKAERELELLLFFPSDDYVDFLEHRTSFELKEEIVLPGAHHDSRERFLVYRLS